ncbi:MAG: hypothetical protein EP330_01000 [Deltaproteobacteria bacterium]|nr:MAG: hypothetical protein EP330_01000 [Deltaproteobacteria bacterium]
MRWSSLLLLGACAGGDPVDSDTASGPGCTALFASALTEPDASGPNTQIHPTSTFDGEHVWVAWNRRDSGSGFDVWVARMDCAGIVDVGPLEVTDSDDNELDPVIAVSGDRVLVAWTSDNGVGPDNLDIRYRVLDVDGNPVGGVQELTASRNGQPVTGNATMPAVDGIEGGFVLAGSWGHEDSPAFQAFAVALGLDGQVLAEAEDGELDAEFGQTDVSVAAFAGDTHLIWQEDSTTSTAPAVRAVTLGGVATQVADVGGRPDVDAGPDGVWQVWDDDAGGVGVRMPVGSQQLLRTEGTLHSASVASFSGGAFVTAMEQVSGIANKIVLWRLDTQGSVIDEHTFSTEGAVSIYTVDVTAVDADRALVVYADGANPDFRIKAEWVAFTP